MTAHSRTTHVVLALLTPALLLTVGAGSAQARSRIAGDARVAPVFGRSVVASPATGRVRVTVPGAKPAILNGARVIPVGSIVDTSQGTAVLVAAAPRRGVTYSADLSRAVFRIQQNRSQAGTTELRLTGKSAPSCRRGRTARYVPLGRVTVPSKRKKSHASAAAAAVGTFRVIGQYQTASNVGPATWTARDDCTATNVTDNAGNVAAATRGGTSRTQSLARGESWTTRCADAGQRPISRGYCEALYAKEYSDGDVFYTPGLFTVSDDEKFDLCLEAPGTATKCSTWAFLSPNRDGVRDGIVTCTATEPGSYAFRWRIRGIGLGVTLPAYHARRGSPFGSPCDGTLGTTFYPVGRSTAPLTANIKLVNRYALPTAGFLGWLSVYTVPTRVHGQETITGIVYKDANGAPGALAGTTEKLTLTSSTVEDYQQLMFEPDVYLPAGNYWVGIITGGTSNVATIRYEPTATLYENANDFALGPTDPFGPLVSNNQQISLHIGYSVE